MSSVPGRRRSVSHQGTGLWGRIRRSVSVRRAPTLRPLPMVGVDAGLWVPAGVIRFLVPVLAFLLARTVIEQGVEIWLIALILIGVLLLRPGASGVAVYTVYLGLLLLGNFPGSVEAGLVVAGVHLMTILATMVGHLSRSTRVELAAFRLPLFRFAVIQVLVQSVLILGLWAEGVDVVLVWLPVVAALGIGLIGWWLLSRLFPQE